MEGTGSWEIEVNVWRREERNSDVLTRNSERSFLMLDLPRQDYSCLLKPARSLRSAPAQKAESTPLAMINTLVAPFPASS